jgi:hypothetical protein
VKTFINNQRLANLAGVNFNSETIKSGPIVYSRTHLVVSQFHELRKFQDCILITSFSDACCTDQMAEKLPSNIRMWFSNNVMTLNPRVTAVPIGLRTSMDGEKILKEAIQKGRQPQKNLVYMNFYRRIRSGNNPRRGMYEQFTPKPWITTEGGFEHVPMEQFYKQIASHPYVLSPPGAGPDCHRHWESIILGSIPIVLRSNATRILDDLPCLQVNTWAEVTEETLIEELPRLQQRFNNTEALKKCYFEYWKERILKS